MLQWYGSILPFIRETFNVFFYYKKKINILASKISCVLLVLRWEVYTMVRHQPIMYVESVQWEMVQNLRKKNFKYLNFLPYYEQSPKCVDLADAYINRSPNCVIYRYCYRCVVTRVCVVICVQGLFCAMSWWLHYICSQTQTIWQKYNWWGVFTKFTSMISNLEKLDWFPH